MLGLSSHILSLIGFSQNVIIVYVITLRYIGLICSQLFESPMGCSTSQEELFQVM